MLKHTLFGLFGASALALAACGEAPPPAPAAEIPAPAAVAEVPRASGAERVGPAVAEATHVLVDSGFIAGIVTMTAKDGEIVARDAYGVQSVETGVPMAEDTIFAIASMTKPVAGVALMILYDEGKWTLDDPVTLHLPELAGMQVQLEDGTRVPAESEMTMRQLVSHTAGFAYGLGPSSPVDTLYFDADISAVDQTPDEFLERLAALPLVAQPGERWIYSIGVDVQGVIIERLSGQSFADFAREQIFTPLGMNDTAFYVPAEKQDRLARIHRYANGQLEQVESTFHFGRAPTQQPAFSSGGAGLYSTAPDYLTFARMMLNDGEWNGVRILSEDSARLMHTNLLPGHAPTTGPGNGTGFGVDFGIIMDPAATNDPRGAGTYYWGGAFGTFFWIDPANDLATVGMFQRGGGGGPPDPNNPIPDPQSVTRAAIYQALAE